MYDCTSFSLSVKELYTWLVVCWGKGPGAAYGFRGHAEGLGPCSAARVGYNGGQVGSFGCLFALEPNVPRVSGDKHVP